MLVAKINQDNSITVQECQEMFPLVTFPIAGPDAAFMEQHNLKHVNLFKIHNKDTHKLVTSEPYLDIDDIVYLVTVEQKTPEELNQSLESAKAKKLAMVNSLYQVKMYCPTPATFPNGIKNIQLRNASEYNMFLSSVTEAMLYVINGAPSTNIIYRTEDNVTQTLTAQQMVAIGQSIKTLKTSIAQSSWNHKDAIRDLTTIESVNSYDITIGWA
jgi:hypothetical protein